MVIHDHSVRTFQSSGRALYVPKTLSNTPTDKHMDMFRIYSEEDLNSLPSGVWGIREPDLEYEGKKRERCGYSFHSLSDGINPALLI
jgi:hypothetical protein